MTLLPRSCKATAHNDVKAGWPLNAQLRGNLVCIVGSLETCLQKVSSRRALPEFSLLPLLFQRKTVANSAFSTLAKQTTISRGHHAHHVQAVRVCHRFSCLWVPHFFKDQGDTECCSYQLRLPQWLRQFFGLPPVARKHHRVARTLQRVMWWNSICRWYRWGGIE